MCDLRFVDCANFLLHPSNGQTYGRSPVWILTWVRRLKSRLNLLPQPSNVHWKGFSPVCTNWCLLSLELSTKALPHSAQTCTRGPWVCRCLRIALLSRNIFVQPLCGQAMVRSTPSMTGGLRTFSLWPGRANSANCFGSDRSKPGIPSDTELPEWLNLALDLPLIYSVYSGSGSGFEPSSENGQLNQILCRYVWWNVLSL